MNIQFILIFHKLIVLTYHNALKILNVITISLSLRKNTSINLLLNCLKI